MCRCGFCCCRIAADDWDAYGGGGGGLPEGSTTRERVNELECDGRCVFSSERALEK